jgi:hypothetical protein
MGQSKGCLVKSVPGTEDGKKRAWHRRLAPKIGTEDQGCLHGCRAPKIAGHRRSHKGCQARLALGIVPGDAWQPVLDSPNWQKACLAPKIGTEDWHRRLAPKIGTEDWHRRSRVPTRVPGAYTGAGHRRLGTEDQGCLRSHKGCQARLALGTSGARFWLTLAADGTVKRLPRQKRAWHRRWHLAPKIGHRRLGTEDRAPKIGHRRSRVPTRVPGTEDRRAPKIAQRVPGTSGARYRSRRCLATSS